jgi:hypothetical protein
MVAGMEEGGALLFHDAAAFIMWFVLTCSLLLFMTVFAFFTLFLFYPFLVLTADFFCSFSPLVIRSFCFRLFYWLVIFYCLSLDRQSGFLPFSRLSPFFLQGDFLIYLSHVRIH